ncbi:MAG: alpha-mannosidase [Verrucomicrobia bacterium]|nr:alpha-mannosidase [Verrucomicrobiota bacterium]
MPSQRLIVHMIGNSHLDPAWLWTWPSGLDEVLATCRTACDLLDAYPEFHVTRGEAWIYEQVLTIAPALFKRIAAHVAAGRWHPVNGWWIQPDCNLPGPESFRRHAALAGRFFRERLGVAVKVGYNVDSFGHCAMIPTFLREAGMGGYIFMRPHTGELPLPGEVFRWRSPAGDEVIGFRIPRAYSAVNEHDLAVGIEAAIATANRALGHTMAFYGIGDHGGGPTRIQIEWIRAHRRYRDDVELRFSHPQAFFDAIETKAAQLPCVEGELQHHAVGCYTSVRAAKREVRRAEEMLADAERAVEAAGLSDDPRFKARLDEAWKRVLFNEFHDIMGGTCIQPVYAQTLEELGFAKTIARDIVVELTRRANIALPPRPRQRIVLDNLSCRVWEGLAEFEPWTASNGSPLEFVFEDEQGAVVPHQRAPAECGTASIARAIFPIRVAAGGRRVLELRRKQQVPSVPPRVRLEGQTLANDRLSVTCGAHGIAALALDGQALLGTEGLRIVVLDDPSDPWSHGVLRYAGACIATFTASQPWSVVESGPLRTALSNTLRAEDAILDCVAKVEAGSPALHLSLRLHWRGKARIVKLIVPPAFAVRQRTDGTPGVFLRRPLDGKEYPVRDALTLQGEGACLTAVSPDVSAGDVQSDGTARLTLLRSPYYAQHDPCRPHALQPVTDQGMHAIEVALLAATDYSEETVRDMANRLNRPLWISETTQGMPAGWTYDRPAGALTEGAPVALASSLSADELMARADETGVVTLVDSGTVCAEWIGDRVLMSEAPTICLRVPVPVDGRYRLAVAHGAGGAFGPVDLCVNGDVVARLADPRPRPRGNITVVARELKLAKGEARVEFRRRSGTRTAIGFVDLTAVYKDLPSAVWTGIGPFVFGQAPNHVELDKVDVATAMKEVVLPPERIRDFEATIMLDDGTALRWQPMADEGDFVDFYRFSGKKDPSIHYAVTHIHAPRAQSVRFAFGMDNWLRMWIAGRLAMPYEEGRGPIIKGQFTFDAELSAGWNEVLVKVASGSGGNGFWLSVSADELTFARRPAP